MHEDDRRAVRGALAAEDDVPSDRNSSRLQLRKQSLFPTVSLVVAGGMAEWSMAVVLKTTKVQAFGGSNPSPSASLAGEPS